MTTGQIVIVAILFGLSFISSAAGVFQKDENNREACIIASMFFTIIITIMLVAATVEMNELSSNNPCPELERLENVYKIK
jgi:cell division protein FtsW (lipid II flippase)